MQIRDVAGDMPNTVNTSVVCTRRYLTGREVEKLIEAARKHGRYGHRDATILPPRASELCDLQWHQVELNTGRLHVRRSKKGTPSVHPMQGDEIRALRRLQREQEASPAATPWRMQGTTRGRCRPGSGTRTSSTRCATRSWRRIGSRTSGDRATRDPTRFQNNSGLPQGLAGRSVAG
jgi:integrase